MKIFLIILFFISTSLSVNVLAYPEIPFCPAGGAPGWMNYMNYKRDQNIWQNNNASHYPSSNHVRFNQYVPNYATHLNRQMPAPATYHTPYRSAETIAPPYYYNNFSNHYRNTTYTPRSYSDYDRLIR